MDGAASGEIGDRETTRAAKTLLLGASYGLIAELLLHPAERDRRRIRRSARRLPEAPEELREPLAAFLREGRAWSAEEYVHTLELSPPCSLYLGAYLFDEPETCRGAGLSQRNGYMVELVNLYRHFGLEMNRRELPDFLPVMVEFLRLSLTGRARRGPELRRYFLERYLAPGLPPLEDALRRHESPYRLLVEALRAATRLDLAATEGTEAWSPPTGGEERVRITCSERLVLPSWDPRSRAGPPPRLGSPGGPRPPEREDTETGA